jgi:arsenate reductase
MKIKVYTLSTCSTSKRILKELNLNKDNADIQDIKFDKITANQIDEMKKLSGSYESLFSKRAQKYKTIKPENRELTEKEIRNYIIEEYTFLKRPVVIIGKDIFIGNSKKNVENLKIALSESI